MAEHINLTLTYDEMDRLLTVLTAASSLATSTGRTKLSNHADAMIFNLADARFDRRMNALEMRRAIMERKGRPYFDHQLEKVKELLEMNDGTT